jgi:tRNA pseudouridine65 synthase
MDIECLYEDDELFVLNKPSGLLVHRGWGVAETALVDFARRLTADYAAHPIQRLDRGASGPVLFAKNPEMAKRLSEWAEEGRCRKDYLAVVRGEIQAELDIDYPISRREDGPRVAARTLVSRIAAAPTEPRMVSLVSATPLTGRLHQIRRHLKHANHPLIGDIRYGHGDLNHAFRDRYRLSRLALHAYRWSVRRPGSERVISGLVPLPEDLHDPLVRMGFSFDEARLPVGLRSST